MVLAVGLTLPAATVPDPATGAGARADPLRQLVPAGTAGRVRRAPVPSPPIPDPPIPNPPIPNPPLPNPPLPNPPLPNPPIPNPPPRVLEERPADADWRWPLRPRPEVVRRFEPPPKRWLPGHRGVDLTADIGQEVRAPADGVVAFSGRVAGIPVVSLDHGDSLRSTYQPVLGLAPLGRAVRAGEVIGYLSEEPGHCAPSACLHWGAMQERAYVDPLALLGRSPIVLLPSR